MQTGTTNHFIKDFIKQGCPVDHNFITHIFKHPRQNLTDFAAITASFKSAPAFLDWYFTAYLPLYATAYQRRWDKAKDIETLAKITPNITPWSFIEKGRALGKVPSAFKDEQTFLSLLDKIMASDTVAKYKYIQTLSLSKDSLSDIFPEAKSADLSDLSQKATLITGLLKQETAEPFTIRKQGTNYTVKALCNPFTKKIVFELNAGKESYILKLSPYNLVHITTDEHRATKENQLLRADSPYTNALIDFYLGANRCKNAAPLCYYNLDYDCALYQKTTGTSPTINDTNPYRFNHKYLHDANLLGIFFNDINRSNFIKEDKTGKVIVIDSGHATYANPANQGIAGKNFTLGNLCGYNIPKLLSPLLL